MMSTGEPMRMHIAESTMAAVDAIGLYKTELRGYLKVKVTYIVKTLGHL